MCCRYTADCLQRPKRTIWSSVDRRNNIPTRNRRWSVKGHMRSVEDTHFRLASQWTWIAGRCATRNTSLLSLKAPAWWTSVSWTSALWVSAVTDSQCQLFCLLMF